MNCPIADPIGRVVEPKLLNENLAHENLVHENPVHDNLAIPPAVPVFQGTQAACAEFGLVLDAKGVPYERGQLGDAWALWVSPGAADMAREELQRYAAERSERREPRPLFIPFPGSPYGAAVYAFVLILVAYCAGIDLFGVNWLEVGSLDSRIGGAGEWWRSLTALTLHLDQEHLMGNLLFGVGIGVLELPRDRPDLPVDELTDHRDDGGLFLGELVHAASLHPAAVPRSSYQYR